MVRPYAVKGKKRKTREEKYDRDEEEAAEQVEEPSKPAMGDENGTQGKEGEQFELEGIPIAPTTDQNPKSGPGVIFILEKASLEIGKVGKTEQLLNSDDHANFLKKKGKNPAHYRPDILHQALLMVLDSPINKAGRLRCVYVKTEDGKLIEIKPYVRIPRTFKRFSGVMLQLLQKLSISAVGKREKLMRMIKNPVTQYLPVNSRKAGLSYSSEKLVSIQKYVAAAENNMDLVFVVGAMAHGKVETDYTDDFVSICSYPLSAAYCITMICQALAGKWNIL
ncbi:putative tRNA (pseudouridine(54)-N(1))-methyltransferase [Rosa chinensis]|uniref:Putative tRNA (Pseudouridine(54)-N(1))-methyltransferase n=1 Tax=Rosa chinensis TaxID=74649 RepID=A0A2P6S9V1_ROSCH|nr:ribosomal RNA small subunit methyltransferase nep-1 [Rosa chinensis]PRQ55473.1 putative tRNA (pseudouridine(54)-N(1))-methyltransferase [Rosa chinensis]